MITLSFMSGFSNPKLRLLTAAGSIAALGAALAGAWELTGMMLSCPFAAGNGPLVAGLIFLGAVQLASFGIIADYLSTIDGQGQRRPGY